MNIQESYCHDPGVAIGVCKHPGTDLIRQYFHEGYTNLEICAMLLKRHDISLSTRQVRRILASLNLKRRGTTNVDTTVQAIQFELEGSGSCLGYRAMQMRLLSRHGLVVPRNSVLEVQRLLDPNGVSARRRGRLSRRVYSNKGPNYLIHVDGYDKLKRFGFAVHGAICGFSRKVLWLKVTYTNNNPRVVASFFLDYIREIEGVPRCVRCDEGTENCLLEDIQKAFRSGHNDNMSGENSVIKGSSHANQRIERWWLSSKQGGGQFWIDLLKDLESTGTLCTSDRFQLECIRFCCTRLIQEDLNDVMREWNQHKIRPCAAAECPAGKPNVMYSIPELYDTVDYKTPVEKADIDALEDFCERPQPSGCEPEFESLCLSLLAENGMDPPRDWKEALNIYGWLQSRLQ